jgi:putative transcriptional regulator
MDVHSYALGAKLERQAGRARVDLGPRILDLRNERGWNQLELARRAGLNPTRLSKLEHGHHEPRIEELVRLAKALVVTLDELVLGERRAQEGGALQFARELEALGSTEEIAGLERLFRLLLLGLAAERRSSRRLP